MRKDLYFIQHPRLSLLITWWYPCLTASIAGNFTYPPWKQEIPLIFSTYLKAYYSPFFLENSLQPGRYYLKFIIDKVWLCDGKMPIAQDLEGNYNNFLTISRVRPKLPRAFSARSLVAGTLLPGPQSLSPALPRIPRGDSERFGSPRPVNFFREDNSNQRVVLCFGSYMAAHPKKRYAEIEEYSSADACFTDFDEQVFGVADGVSEWETFGLDPSLFPKELIRNFREEFSVHKPSSAINDLETCGFMENILNSAYKRTKKYGSSTVLLGMCRNSHLYTLCIGDSGYIILRPRESGAYLNEIYRSCEQQHSFNCPYQLARMPGAEKYEELVNKGLGSLVSLLRRSQNANLDLPQDAHAEIIPLQPMDIIIAGSDGLFDNIYDSDILRISENIMQLQ